MMEELHGTPGKEVSMRSRPLQVKALERGGRRLHVLVVIASLAVLSALGVAWMSGKPGVAKAATAHASAKGGVYRTATSGLELTDNLDPTGEDNVALAFELYSALQTTLVGYNGAAGTPGLTLQPELATSIPKPTDHGLTYTFHLHSNLKFGPPLDRTITSHDVAYAFQRINDKAMVPQYGYYYVGVIKGMTGTAKSANTPISGISTPNKTTIVFHLTHPQGDFLQELAQPATAPIPAEVAKCFTTAGTYGRDLISSGPYMIQGSPEVNASSCKTIKPISGFNPTTGITLVRNPDYVREAGDPPDYLDGFQVTVDSNVSDIFDKVQRGELDGSVFDSPPATVLATNVGKPSLHSNPIYQSESITMNLTVPPFTNVHVRKAVEWVLNKAAIQKVLGGPDVASIATHINPAGYPGSLPASYNPYATPGNGGSLAKAKAQMRLSPFDPKHDGKCDVSVCHNIVFINLPSYEAIDPIVQTDLAEIGIDIEPRVLTASAAFLAIQNVKAQVPMSALGGGGADYTGANSFAAPNFASSAITGPSSCCDYSDVSMTKQQAKSIGVPYPKGGIPSVDSIVDKCNVELGSEQDACFEKLDSTMMTKVAAWAPYLWARYVVITAPTVTHYVQDPATGLISIRQIQVNNGLTLPAS
jgi:peptide/nickel transport system substrate-binding protein